MFLLTDKLLFMGSNDTLILDEFKMNRNINHVVAFSKLVHAVKMYIIKLWILFTRTQILCFGIRRCSDINTFELDQNMVMPMKVSTKF